MGNPQKYERIGISIGGGFDIETLPAVLSRIAKFGFIHYVELDANTGGPIIGGRINKYIMREVKKILSDYNFKYTVHKADLYDLRDIENIALNQEMYKVSLQYAQQIGAEVFVDHYNVKTNNPRVEAAFEESLSKMAEAAHDIGVTICLENIETDPFMNTLECIKKIDHPDLRMTVDFGHAYLTSRYFGDDFLGNIAAAKPYLRHIHIHDNLGIFDTARLAWQQKSLKQRLPFGKGDLHLPIGWGEIPFKDVFKILGDDYSGIYMLENSVGTNERFVPDIVGTLLDLI